MRRFRLSEDRGCELSTKHALLSLLSRAKRCGPEETSRETAPHVKAFADAVLPQTSLLKLRMFGSFVLSSSLIYRSENAGKLTFNIFSFVLCGLELLKNKNKNHRASKLNR